ncbi:hypothetical protein EJ02DRAFT_457044 [Clathrospora elynae]|uniref:Uncharacterized protein n=1 Tax=Clathrospora elynae TaxID=706981 RepID=A0A6A5SGU0_9PLEO|nr:hypothetical protein EJ02DRAFT_457044 [Clathrospora elynae]
MSPKESQATSDKNDAPKSEKPAVSEEEVRQESGKAASAALAAQKKVKELKDAAAAAGDPDERQKLTEEAVNAQVEAESFGKTAKYLRSGTFQGMAMGTGLGVAPGATLGAITGTLVGGVSSTILGGLGAGVGSAAGALHGPWMNIGKVAGKGMKKLTGGLPGWAASDEQKKALEKMMGQVNEEEMPGADELEKFKNEGGGGEMDEGWLESAKGMMPNNKDSGVTNQSSAQEDSGKNYSKSSGSQNDQPSSGDSGQKKDSQGRKKPRKLNAKSSDADAETSKTNDGSVDAPEPAGTGRDGDRRTTEEQAKKIEQREGELDEREAALNKREKELAQREQDLESRPDSSNPGPAEAPKTKVQPRKLQTRSS